MTVVGATAADIRDVIVEGESGFLNVAPPWNRPRYWPSKRRLTWGDKKSAPVQAVATLISADEPDRLRGPQCDTAICDELAAWKYPEAWDQLQFGLRLGNDPRVAVATTPRPTPLIKQLLGESAGEDPSCRVTRGSTYENRANLAAPFIKKILARYEGTRLGRQELDGEVLDDAAGSLWKRDQFEGPNGLRVAKAPCAFVRIVVAVDPSVGGSDAEARAAAEENSDDESGIPTGAETGIVAAALGEDDIIYILEDSSIIGPTPLEWGTAAVATYSKLQADRIVGEVNNGGDLVESNVRSIDPEVSFKQVHASRGKQVRAEPVAARYEQRRVRHVGFHRKLEDQMVQWEPGVSTWSPNRVDALVWACTELMEPGVTGRMIRVRSRRR